MIGRPLVHPGAPRVSSRPVPRFPGVRVGTFVAWLSLLSPTLPGSLLALLPAVSQAQAEPPSVLLVGANTPRAKALALDAALIKGWSVAQSERDHVVFETLLVEPASTGPPNAPAMGRPADTLLRIRADFTRTEDGARVTLRAEEVWYRGTPSRWSTDVTARYRANLMNALNSLQGQWAVLGPVATPDDDRSGMRQGAIPSLIERMQDMLAPRPATVPSPRPTRPTRAASGAGSSPRSAASTTPSSGTLPSAAAEPGGASRTSRANRSGSAFPPLGSGTGNSAEVMEDAPIGLWAYYAERYAQSQGCTLGDVGAVLLAEQDGDELHRVACVGAPSLRVRCDREGCGPAR